MNLCLEDEYDWRRHWILVGLTSIVVMHEQRNNVSLSLGLCIYWWRQRRRGSIAIHDHPPPHPTIRQPAVAAYLRWIVLHFCSRFNCRLARFYVRKASDNDVRLCNTDLCCCCCWPENNIYICFTYRNRKCCSNLNLYLLQMVIDGSYIFSKTTENNGFSIDTISYNK